MFALRRQNETSELCCRLTMLLQSNLGLRWKVGQEADSTLQHKHYVADCWSAPHLVMIRITCFLDTEEAVEGSSFKFVERWTFLLLQTKCRWNNPTWKTHVIIEPPDIILSDVTCWRCSKPKHFANQASFPNPIIYALCILDASRLYFITRTVPSTNDAPLESHISPFEDTAASGWEL